MRDPNFEIIEAYLDGLLSAKDRLDLEARMAANPLLASEVDAQRIARMATRHLGETALQSRLKNILEDLDNPSSPTPTKPRMGFFHWATLVLFTLLVLALWKIYSSPDTHPSGPANTPSSIGAEAKDALIAQLETEFRVVKRKLDSLEAQTKLTPAPDQNAQQIQVLKQQLDEKERQILQLQSKPVSAREIAMICLPPGPVAGRTQVKQAGGQIKDAQFESAATAFEERQYGQVIPQLFPKGPPFILHANAITFTDTSELDVKRLALLGETFLKLDQIPQAIACFEAPKRRDPFEQDLAEWNIFRCKVTQPAKYRSDIRKFMEYVEQQQSNPYKEELARLKKVFELNKIPL